MVRITGDDKEGKAQLSYFLDNDEPYPVIATTSKLMSTGVDAKTCKLVVLDQNINSMTEFKQIIGRGTRLREDYQKLFFTIMDFKGATRLFADPDFDGEPVVIYEPGADDPVVPPEDDGGEETLIDENGIPIFPENSFHDIDNDWDTSNGVREKPSKYHIDDVAVRTAVERSQYLDVDGRLITEDYRVFLKEDIRRTLRDQYQTLQDFLRRWNESDRKKKMIDELERYGIPIDVLKQAVTGSEKFDVFDLVSHIAFDQKPLTRRERANNIKKRNYFGKYGDQAREVLESLLEKYAHNGIADLEDPKVLELPPFDRFGSKTQIRRGIFGGNEQFTKAITELEQALYDNDQSMSA